MKIEYGLADEAYKCVFGINGSIENSRVFENRSISLVSAKNTYAAFQICFKADGNFTVSVGSSPVFSPRGKFTDVRLVCSIEMLPDAKISMYPELYMEDDDGIYKADILSSDETIEVEPGQTQPVWMEIGIDADAKPGIYKGRIDIYTHRMFEDEVKLDTLYFDLDIKNLTMPDPKDYKYFLDLWQHPSNIARKHEVRMWSDEHFEVLEKYVKTLAQLGQKAITVLVSEIPWSGQFCYRVVNYPSNLFEYSMVRVEKDKKGIFTYNYTAMERYIKLCFMHGIDKEIEVFGLFNIWTCEEEGYGRIAPDYPDAVRIRYFDRQHGCYMYMKTSAEIKGYIKALEQYFIDNMWIDKVRICADEPSNPDAYQKNLEMLKKTSPGFKYKAAINRVQFIDKAKDIDDCVLSLRCAVEQWGGIERIRKNIKGKLMFYVSCGPRIPNTFLCSSLLESQLLGILAGLMNFDGFLRWNYAVWPENPRVRIRYQYPIWRAGDTNFVYPGNNGKPLLTLRYKNLKRGIEFYELIQMARTYCKNGEEIIRQVRDKVLKTDSLEDFSPDRQKTEDELFSREYKDYRDALEILLECEHFS